MGRSDPKTWRRWRLNSGPILGPALILGSTLVSCVTPSPQTERKTSELARAADSSKRPPVAVTRAHLREHAAVHRAIRQLSEQIAQGTGDRSLEKQMAAANMSLQGALASNPLLQDPDLGNDLLAVLRSSQDSQAFRTSVRDVLRQTAQKWGVLSAALDRDMSNSASSSTDDPSQGAPMTPTGAQGLGDVRYGDALFAQAQDLADKSQYVEAIRVLRSIPLDSSHGVAAQETIKSLSNRAVQDLRRKAAQAYQSASPAAEIKVKIGYLEQSKSLLESALQDFPESEHVPTVRDNLTTIERELETLRSGNP